MKKIINLFFILTLIVVGFTSCEQEEVAGRIPGMGNTSGELEIKEPFTTPEGVVINLQSEDETTLSELFSTQAQLKSTEGRRHVLGCGGSIQGNDLKFWIKVKLTVQNTSDNKMCFTLPTGLVFKVSDEQYQNGITVSPINICIEAHSLCNYSLVLMCVNEGKDGSHTNVPYKIVGVTKSPQMWKLLNMLYNRKCNIGFYTGDEEPSAGLKSASALDLEKYKEVADQIQHSIWAITNGDGMTKEQEDYIKTIPFIEE